MTKNLWFAWCWNQAKFSLSTVYKAKEKWEKRNEQKMKTLFNCSYCGDQEGPHTLIRKHANKLKVHQKTERTAIKQDLSPDLKPFDYTIWGVLENKTYATSHPNIGSLKTAIGKEWNKTPEELFWSHANYFKGVLI